MTMQEVRGFFWKALFGMMLGFFALAIGGIHLFAPSKDLPPLCVLEDESQAELVLSSESQMGSPQPPTGGASLLGNGGVYTTWTDGNILVTFWSARVDDGHDSQRVVGWVDVSVPVVEQIVPHFFFLSEGKRGDYLYLPILRQGNRWVAKMSISDWECVLDGSCDGFGVNQGATEYGVFLGGGGPKDSEKHPTPASAFAYLIQSECK